MYPRRASGHLAGGTDYDTLKHNEESGVRLTYFDQEEMNQESMRAQSKDRLIKAALLPVVKIDELRDSYLLSPAGWTQSTISSDR